MNPPDDRLSLAEPAVQLPPPMASGPKPQDVARVTLGVACLVAMLAGTLWILRPFLGAMIWAATIVVATWPIMMQLETRVGGRRAIAAATMSVVLLLGFIVPLGTAITVLIVNSDRIIAWATSVASMHVPPPPDWVIGIPIIGPTIAERWREVLSAPTDVTATLSPYTKLLAAWLLGLVGGVASLAIDLLLIMAISAYLYARGDEAADFLHRFARRIAGARGPRAVTLAGGAIRGIAMGVIVTAVIQALLAGIGLAVVGIPFAAILTVVAVFLAIAQIGVMPVLGPAVAWLYWTGSYGWATGLLVWTIFVVSFDNVMRPILIRRGADIPLPLIFAGVLGGMIGFGVIGIFIGPVLLAVTYTLLSDWIESGEAEDTTPPQ
jgi:predicted PurR-regulated permease PerM